MALTVDITVELRAFALELSLEVGCETVALAGPSGAGKTTALRALAGLTRPARGRIAIGDRVWFEAERDIHEPPERRAVGMVFQNYALFPHMSVRDNVRFAGSARADEMLERFGIAHVADARPRVLSGGERQRVALARALARAPDVLLLDEPLSALDARTRVAVRAELRDAMRAAGIPVVLVTHDYEDAATLADRVAIVGDGRLLQVGAPADVVAAPAHPDVASFVGANVLPGRASPAGAGLTRVDLRAGGAIYSADRAGGDVGAVVNPWDVSVARAEPDDSALNRIRGRVTSVVELGSRVRIRIGPVVAELTAASARRLGIAEGEVVIASFKATATRLVPLGGLPGDENGTVE